MIALSIRRISLVATLGVLLPSVLWAASSTCPPENRRTSGASALWREDPCALSFDSFVEALAAISTPIMDADFQVGIQGTDGDDVLSLTSPLTTQALALAPAGDIDLTLVGDASEDVSATSTVTAVGIAGGAGNDDIQTSSPASTSSGPPRPWLEASL